MNKYKAIILLLYVLFLSSCVAASSFQLIDTNDKPIKDQIIEVDYITNQTTNHKLYITNSSGYLNIELPKDYSDLTFMMKKEEKSYFAPVIHDLGSIRLVPIAKISGFILDEKNNLLKHVILRIFCSSTYSEIPVRSDDFGYFEIEKVGLGDCEINVIKGNKIMNWTFNINESREYNIKIVITEDKYSSNGYLIIPATIILAILLILMLYFYKRTRLTQTEKSIKLTKENLTAENNNKKEFNQRQKDIMKTLSMNENLIIKCLFEQEFPLTQSQVRYTTNLPKTSLHRYISMLQQKEIVTITEYGKLRKLELTDFFLK